MSGKVVPHELPCPRHERPVRIVGYRGGDNEYRVECGYGHHELSGAEMAAASADWPDAPMTPADLTEWAEQIIQLTTTNISDQDRTELLADAAVQLARRVVGEEER